MKDPFRMSENDLKKNVSQLLRLRGWRFVHFRPGQGNFGWKTPYDAGCDGKGFPDILAIRGRRGIVAELKSAIGRPTEAQRDWLRMFADCEWKTYLWRPKDWLDGTIERELR